MFEVFKNKVVKEIILLLVFYLFFSCTNGFSQVKIKVDAGEQIGRLDPFWASQIIHPTEFLLTGWGHNLLDLMAGSGAAKKFIRIYNQPEVAFRKDKEGRVSYEWSRFDQMADMILSKGLRLEIVVFGMPKDLARFPESVRKRPYGVEVCTSPPKNYEDWKNLCRDFAQHLMNRYGEDQIRNWTIRCWNEPDGNFLYQGDLKEYVKMYDYFSEAFKSVSLSFRIGGPALTSSKTAVDPSGFRFFLNHVINGTNYATGEKGTPIDFISIHTYGGSSGGPAKGRKSPEVQFMLDNQIRMASIRDEFPELKNKPIFVEEWGETSGGARGVDDIASADIRNSEYSAAFLVNWVARHIRLKQNKDLHFENFTFCASGYEKIPERNFMGYRTLDTKDGFHKPILNGYKLLNKLDSNLVEVSSKPERNDVIAIATTDENQISVILVNYQAEDLFNKGDSVLVDLDIKVPWASNQKMTMRYWRIDKTHSNAYTAFQVLNSPRLPNPIEIDFVKQKMDIELMENPRGIKMDELRKISLELPSNSVSLIQINKAN